MPAPDPREEFHEPIPPSIWQLLNLPEPRRSDNNDSPAVDRELLRRLVRKELSSGATRAVYRLIDAFDCWKVAFAEIVIEEFRQRFPHGSKHFGP
jgi:hypothetical protein